VLEDITGVNVFGNRTGLPGEVTLSLGADGKVVSSTTTRVTVVTFGIDAERRVYIAVPLGRALWTVDGRSVVEGRHLMIHRNTFIESRARFNGLVCFRWKGNFESDHKLTLFTEPYEAGAHVA
jgi:hypothetical protein